jgi:hypothetical protein
LPKANARPERAQRQRERQRHGPGRECGDVHPKGPLPSRRVWAGQRCATREANGARRTVPRKIFFL